jgi:hypothetical protein
LFGGGWLFGGGGSVFGGRGDGLGFLLFLLLLFAFLLAAVDLLVAEEVGLLIGFKESCDVEGSVALDEEGDLVEEGDEGVDGDLGFVFGEVGDEEFFCILLDP